MIQNIDDLRKAVSANNQKWGRSGTVINRFSKLRAMQKNAQDFYDLNYKIEIQEEYRKIKLPTARQMVDTFVSHLPLTNPVVEVIPYKATEAYSKKAVKQQEFYQALLQHSLNQTEPAIPYAAKDQGLRGEAFLKVIYDIAVMENTPKKKDGEGDEDFETRKHEYLLERMPLLITCPEPQNCYPFGGEIDCRPVEMIEVYPAYVSDIKAIWPEWITTKKDMDTEVFIEYWNDDKRCFLAGGTVVTDGFEDNPYGKVPYVHIYSGWGHRTPDNEPEKKAVNMIFEAEDLIKQQCRWNAYLDKAVSWASMPTAEAEGAEEDYGETGLRLEPGIISYGGEGRNVKVSWVAQNLPAGILQAIGMNDAQINKVQPGVLKGEAPRGIEAGYPMALMIGESRLQFGVPFENLKTLVARALELVRYIIRDISDEDLPLWGESKALTLGSKDCQGAFRIKVDFDSISPEAKAERALAGQRLRQGGSISRYTELEVWQNNKNPDKEIARMDAESILKHPVLQREAAVEAVREIKGEQAAMRVEQAMAEGEAGAVRKGESTGIPVGGRTERELPETVLAGAMTKRSKALRGSTER